MSRHVRIQMINTPGTFQNVPRTFTYVLNHVMWGPTVRGRPDLAGSLSRRVRTDSRVELCYKSFDTGRTAHFRAVGAQRAALTPDVRPVAPTSHGWSIWPAMDRARPGECHGTSTHVTAAAVNVCWHHPRPEHLRLAPFHRWCRTCDSATKYWNLSSNRREFALEADAESFVLSWNHLHRSPKSTTENQ